VLISEDHSQGISYLIQTSGLGGLRHNTVVIPWPEQWSKHHNGMDQATKFATIIRNISAAGY
jgi:potassium/chloride transporter 4/5/6